MNLCPFVPRPHLILYKMLALSSLVLATMLLSAPAHAGYWVFTCPGSSGNYTITNANNGHQSVTNWTPPGPQNRQFYLGQFGGGSDYSSKTTVTISVTVTATWRPDPNLPSDPAPPTVWLCESASTEWTQGTIGSANDGFGDAPVAHTNGSGATSSTSPGSSLPPAHWTKCNVSGGVATLPIRTLMAEGDYTIQNPSPPFGGLTYAAVDSYQVTVHPQPYNFHQLGPTMDNGDGTLSFNYVWNSTSGNLSDIGSGCTIYEYVSYDGNSTGTYFSGPPAGYAPPHPPVGPGSNGGVYAYFNPSISPNPTVPGGAASAGTMNDTQDKPYSFAASSSCIAATWTSTQTYKFDDTATGEKAIVVPGPGAGPMTITRRVYLVGTPPYVPSWYYTVNKSGSTSTPLLITP